MLQDVILRMFFALSEPIYRAVKPETATLTSCWGMDCLKWSWKKGLKWSRGSGMPSLLMWSATYLSISREGATKSMVVKATHLRSFRDSSGQKEFIRDEDNKLWSLLLPLVIGGLRWPLITLRHHYRTSLSIYARTILWNRDKKRSKIENGDATDLSHQLTLM